MSAPKSSTAPGAPSGALPDVQLLGDQATLYPGVEAARVPTERNLVEHMTRFRESPLDFLREVSMYVSGQGWRAYDHPIGQPIFYKGFSEKMMSKVMATEMLRNRIDELAEKRAISEDEMGLFGERAGKEVRRAKRKEELVYSLTEVAEKMVDNMICKMDSKTFIRGAYWIATKLLTQAYHQGIHVSSEEVLRLRTVAEKAAKDKQSIIFLPCHKSHVDYVSLQLICYRLGIALPTVVAGDNLNIPALGSFLQSAGAMWIRRSFAGDALYTTVVQSYIDTLLNNGFHFECFIEGGRSRTGKLLPPKFGILSFLMDAVISGRCEDAIVCPVSTQYDKVIETESYVSELLGRPKKSENIKDFISSSSVLSLKLGRVDVRFHEPWSLKGFIQEQQLRMTSIPQQIEAGRNPVSDSRVRILRTMGYKVLSDINAVSVVMPTALIGTVLLTLRGRGVGRSELVRRVEWLSENIRKRGGRVAHFYGAPTSVVVDRAIEVLGPGLVGRVDGLAEETYFAVDRFQMSFYRNMTIHLFISEALVCCSMYTRVKLGGGPDNQKITYDALYQQVAFLSQLFAGEFIYETKGLKANLSKTLHRLQADGVINICRSGTTILAVELSDLERSHGRENFDFYLFLLFPYIEAQWLGSISLMALTPPVGQTEPRAYDLKQVQDMAQLAGKTLYHQGDLSYFEAVNKEVLKNALERFEEEGIIVVSKSREAKTAATVKLADGWVPQRAQDGSLLPQGRLWDFIELIAKSRREGKNRRDGATVSDRVLSLVDRLGHDLYQRSLGLPPVAIEESAAAKKQKRRTQLVSNAARL